MKIDYEYICKIISNLSTLPIRLYKGNKKDFYYTLNDYKYDPADLIKDKLFEKQDNIDYVILEDLSYYGIVNSKNYKVVLGPSRKTPFTEQEIKELFLKMKLSVSEYSNFNQFISNIIPVPLQSTLQVLCTINYILNDEKKTLDDFFPEYQSTLENSKKVQIDQDSNDRFNNTYLIEQSMLDIVRSGDVDKLKRWVKTVPAANGGVLSKNALRHIKNTFIVSTTVVSRAAIDGGMDVDEALSLSDYYIQKEELMNDGTEITFLQYSMVLDFTSKVNSLTMKDHHQSKIIQKVKSYVKENITEAISVEDIANYMNIERSTLSKRFKAETGENLSDYIIRKKIEKSKLLIKNGYSLISISTYLALSSQSYFTKLFTKYVGVTPSKYKKDNHY